MKVEIQKIDKKQILKQVIFRSKKRLNQIDGINHNNQITHTQKKWLQVVTIFRIDKVQQRINEILKNNITKNTTKSSIWKEGECEREGTFEYQNKISKNKQIKNLFNKIKSVANITKKQVVKIHKIKPLLEIGQISAINSNWRHR